MSPMRFTVLLLLGLAACDGDGKPADDDAVVDVDEDEDVDPDEDDPNEDDQGDGDDGARDPRGGDGDPVTPPIRRKPDGVPVPHPRTPPGGGGGGGGGTGDDEDTIQPPVPRNPAAPGAPRTPPKPVSPMPVGIVQVSDTRWTVTQSLVDRWMKSTSQVGRVRDAGDGWSVNGVRTRAAYHLGMRNGDVIMEVNGHKLNSKVNLLAAYLDLKNDKSFDVVFYRNGARRVHHYDIVGG